MMTLLALVWLGWMGWEHGKQMYEIGLNHRSSRG